MVTGFPSLSRQAVLPCVEAALPSMVDIAYPCVSLAPLRQKCTFINTCLVAARKTLSDVDFVDFPQRRARCPSMHVLASPSAARGVQRTPPQTRRQRRAGVCRCAAPPEPAGSEQAEPAAAPDGKKTVNRVNLFDPAATLSRLITRRFGFVGGLAFVGILAATEGGAIIQALLEDVNTKEVEVGTLTTLPGGLVAQDVKVRAPLLLTPCGSVASCHCPRASFPNTDAPRQPPQIGGGSSPSAGDFVGAHFKVTAQAPGDAEPSVVLDTRATGRPLAWVFNKPKKPVEELRGVEQGVVTMKRCVGRAPAASHRVFGNSDTPQCSGGVRVLTFPTGLGLGAPLGGLPGPLPGLRVEIEITEVSPAYFAS